MEYIAALVKLNNQLISNCFTAEESVEKIYHYTSLSGLKSIIKHGELRFTDQNYMNDSHERRYVLELCLNRTEEIIGMCGLKDEFRKQLEERLKEKRWPENINGFNTHICCFSTDGDSLPMWNYYTKGDSIKGYNLEFDVEKLTTKLEIKCSPKGLNGQQGKEHSPLHHGRVIYEESCQIAILKKMTSDFIGLYEKYKSAKKVEKIDICDTIRFMIDRIQEAGVFFKNPCFSHEKEYRIEVSPYWDGTNGYISIGNIVEFFEKDGYVIPYIDFCFDKSSLKGITVSPTVEIDIARNGLLRLCQSSKVYTIIEPEQIYKSKVPVRY